MLKGLAPCSGMSASRSTTCAPRSASRRPSVLPMKPRPPVTRTRLPVKEAGAVMSVARGRPSDRDWSPGSEVLALHDEPPPPAEQGEQRGGDPCDVEELRVAVLPVPVMHRHFDEQQPRVLHLLHQLDGDATGRGLEHQALQYAAPHDAEVAVYVSDPETKGELDGVLVDEADHDAVKRVVPFELLHHAALLPLRASARTVRPNGSPVRATSGASRRSSQRRGTFSAPNSTCRSGVPCAAGRKRSEFRFSTATGKRNILAYETCSIVKPAWRSLALTARAV